MAFKDISTLIDDEFIDSDIINDIVNNLNHLKNVMPNVGFKTSASTTKSESGKHFRIVSGRQSCGTFKGPKTVKMQFGFTAEEIPTVIPVFYHTGGASVNVVVTKLEKTQFYVRLLPANSKTTIKGGSINWIAILPLA